LNLNAHVESDFGGNEYSYKSFRKVCCGNAPFSRVETALTPNMMEKRYLIIMNALLSYGYARELSLNLNAKVNLAKKRMLAALGLE
jgi:hypothetical protein